QPKRLTPAQPAPIQQLPPKLPPPPPLSVVTSTAVLEPTQAFDLSWREAQLLGQGQSGFEYLLSEGSELHGLLLRRAS
ncbi:hypothetical protein ABZ299_35065, partial [Streptomyces sp. NPDC006184]|uniref:hypothetical protein n=1 Tax=Streptomyces sp. NPDC006184 TaxID=3155455 RepID=UPI0033BE462C